MKFLTLSTSLIALLLLGAACSSNSTSSPNTNTLTNTGSFDTSLSGSNTNVNDTDTNSSAANTNVAQSAPTSVTVQVNDSGFTPSQLTIKKGTTVIFQNTGRREHQVGSNPHPDHTDLPGFDLEDMAPGTSTQFTFVETGTFGYHNHNFDELRATITVTE